jgi:hypothetical protein
MEVITDGSFEGVDVDGAREGLEVTGDVVGMLEVA